MSVRIADFNLYVDQRINVGEDLFAIGDIIAEESPRTSHRVI